MSKPLRLLVVDDDDAGREILGLTLRQAGFHVKAVSGGEEALKLLRRKQFDILVTDARMSPIDGFELSSRAKKLRPRLRILMMSALDTERDTREYPIDQFYAKPVPVDRLLNWLSAVSA